jgi:cell division GTPase FtsZ
MSNDQNFNDFDIDVPSNPTEASQAAPAPVNNTQTAVSGAIDLPDIAIGSRQSAPQRVTEPDAKDLAVKFGIIGAGQGGSRLADTFWQIGYRRVCALNTTAQDFLGLTIPAVRQRVLSSEGGAGKDPSRGADILAENHEEIMNLMRFSLGEDIDRILITVGAGGGTGSGFALGLVRLARYYLKNLGKEDNVGIVISMPKKTEGGRVQHNAYHLIQALRPMIEQNQISPVVIVDNESINQMFPNISAKQFWATANKNIVGLFDIFNVLACQQSAYVTFDRADYKSVLDSGILIFGATKIDSYKYDTDIADGLRINLQRTLLADVDISKATHCAAILCANDAVLSVLPQNHIELAFSVLERILGGEGKNLVLHQGVYESKRPGLFLYTMVGGLKLPEKRLELMKLRSGMPEA